MVVNAYLNVTQEQWEEIKKKYVEPNMYHIVSNSKRKCKRCDDCKMYNPCSTYEGFCLETNELVDGNSTCESWYQKQRSYWREIIMWTPCDEPIEEYNEETGKMETRFVPMHILTSDMKMKCVETAVDLVQMNER